MAENRKLTIGILAHVDAGKTTLSEAVLYKTGAIRKMGRVDHQDAFLDSDAQEKQRGITIFSGQAEFTLPAPNGSNACATDVILLDTPGHVDFSAEMERTLQVLDYAVLVISGKDGVQGHTATLWKLLKRYSIPTFVFVNKMDLDGTNRMASMTDLQMHLSTGCMDFSCKTNTDPEEMAMCDENLLEEFLETGTITNASLAKAIQARHIFPCYFGSALKNDGVDELLEGLAELTIGYGEESAAPLRTRTFRITRDKQGDRLTHMKILSGTLRVRDTIVTGGDANSAAGQETTEEKINQIRIYNGDKYRTVDEAGPGSIVAVTGPAGTQIDGNQALEAVMTYSVILPEGVNVHDTYTKLKQLEEEDPQLHITWNEQLQEIQLRLMGKVQLEILQTIIKERFGVDATFSDGRIAYKETISKPVYGAGHYEPLRHYAEVHLKLEPLPTGSGMKFGSEVSEDVLDRNWQRLIMTHLLEREHTGTLTGSPITDMKITIAAGRAHDKHTEGGDFRQATYRAIRQGLRKSLAEGNVILLEPWYEFELEVPQEMIGRAMADIQRMGGSFDAPETADRQAAGTAILRGKAPVSEMKDYVTEVASYTKGYGHLNCTLAGYEPCHNQDEVVSQIEYDPDRDTANPADSIFCEHGAGHNIQWDKADEMMHVTPQSQRTDEQDQQTSSQRTSTSAGLPLDDDLERIFDRTFRKNEDKKRNIEAREFDSELERRRKEAERRRRANEAAKKREEMKLPEFLLVDGYNIIFAWDELKELAKVNIDAAREALIEILNNYQGFRKCSVIAVFDAYKVKGGQRHFEKNGDVTVVYTKEAETADTYIERTTYELSGKGNAGDRKYRVRVATSDRLEQMIIMGNNASRVSATDFKKEVEQVNAEIAEFIRQLTRRNRMENPNRLVIPKENTDEKNN